MLWCFSVWESFWKMDLLHCRSASNLSVVRDFGVVLCVSVTSGATTSVCGVASSGKLCWTILLLMLNAGPSEWPVDSMVIVVGLCRGNSTRCERQSAALLQAPDIHSKVMLYVASSNPHLLTLLFAFFSIDKSCQWFAVIAYYYFSSLKVIIPFCDCVIYTIGFLFCSAPFPLSFSECMWKESYWEFCSILFLWKLCSTGVIRCTCINYVAFFWIGIV